MSASSTTTTVTVSSAHGVSSSSVPVVSSSSTTISSISSAPVISSSSITVTSSSTQLVSSSSVSTSSPSSSPSPSLSQPSIPSSSAIPTPPSHHTASQTLSPSHLSAEPSSLLQIATPIAIPPPTSTSISLLTQLQDALDFISTLLGLFFVSLLTLLLIYWSTLYILRKTIGISPRDTSPIAQLKNKNKNNTPNSPSSPKSPTSLKTTSSLPQKKEVGFAPHPSDTEFILAGKKAQETKRRLSSIPQSPTTPTSTTPPHSSSSPYTLFPSSQPWPTDGVQLAGLGSVSESEKDKVEKIAQATDAEELGEASGRKKEDVLAEADLEFQRGVRDVSGDTDAIERRGGRSYGAL
ncbi:uncharacterized protein EAE97_000842 [Botrytis byssoidea]|uniref:Uncharacterized protein n=1 Tax=Botrytis byssoidea TaxID=139641 RepID=A0A9P5IX77_9HELO|nr:uncharacterized protein EAE97_000842 [Botrytis byssoidea]KAF7953443.1 hypothetical protein EAE97_000842 [Botrytis byssoidea]